MKLQECFWGTHLNLDSFLLLLLVVWTYFHKYSQIPISGRWSVFEGTELNDPLWLFFDSEHLFYQFGATTFRMWAEWRYRHQARRKYRHQAHHTAADINFLTQMQDELNRLQTRHVEQQWKLALLFSSLQTGCFFSSCGGFTDACYLSCRRPLWRQTAHQGEWHDEWQVENITKWSGKRAGTASSSLFSERNCAYCNFKCPVDYSALNKFEVTANNVDRETERWREIQWAFGRDAREWKYGRQEKRGE